MRIAVTEVGNAKGVSRVFQRDNRLVGTRRGIVDRRDIDRHRIGDRIGVKAAVRRTAVIADAEGKVRVSRAVLVRGRTEGQEQYVGGADDLTGNKRATKVAYRHSGYPGGLREVGYEELLSTRPERAVELAVKGMLPHNRLGRALIGKLKVYAGAEHPHAAQQPVPFEIKQVAQ